MKNQKDLNFEIYRIDFLNSEKNFKKESKFFTTWKEAIDWGRKNLSNFLIDMIHIDESKNIKL